jgi:hypothetical protein
MLAQDYIPYPSETQYIAFMRATYLELFPKLIDQSQFNRRARSLRLLVAHLRRHWIQQKGWHLQAQFLLDTKPVPVVGYKRSKRHSDFAGSANYGKCASRNMQYFGYKLVTLSTLSGIPVMYDLVPANTDEVWPLKPSLTIWSPATSSLTKASSAWSGKPKSLIKPTT